MVDDVKDITETAESKAATEALDRARLARERREAEQRKRLDELRAHAAAAQAQREKRDEDRRRRQAEQRARDEDRRVQVEERKRAIWEASVSRRESLLQREKDRSERLERARASRSSPRPAFAFGSSTPRLLEPVDSGGFFWAARRAASTTNVMYASAPLTRRASALHLDSSDEHNKDEAERPQPLMWSSVARRRTDLVPTIPAPRLQGRAYSMTRLDRIPSRPLQGAESVQHLNRQPRSGETTPGSRPGSALSAHAQVVRRTASAPRRPRPASIAGTGMNTPRGNGAESVSASLATTPVVSRDASTAERRARRPRPLSMHAAKTPQVLTPGEGKPPLHRKPKLSKDHEKSGRVKSVSASPRASAERNPELNAHEKNSSTPHVDKCQVSAIEVTQKLEALQIQNGHDHVQLDSKVIENKENVEPSAESKPMEVSQQIDKPVELQKPVEKREEKKESQDKTEENEMTASMSARRITTEEQAKAALAERRRRAREELERQAEIERLRLQREAEEEAERQRVEEERQRREEQEARELARLQREMEEEKLRKAIEAQQQLERDEAERKSREEAEKVVRLKEEEEKKKAAEEAEKVRREEAEREERERVLRKQRVEEIMMRTRLRKAEEDKKQQESKVSQPPTDNGNAEVAMHTSQSEVKTSQQDSLNSTPNETKSESNPTNNGNTVDLLGLFEQNDTEDKKEITTNNTQNSNSSETNNGNHPTSDIGHISANFIQTERLAESQSKMAEPSKMADVKLIEDDFTTHNGHNASHNNHPLTLQNAI